MFVPPDAITSPSWARSLWNFSGRDGSVSVWINAEGKFGELPMIRREVSFIRRTMRRLDRITGLSFRETSNPNRSDIEISAAANLDGSTASAYRNRGWFAAFWQADSDTGLTQREKWGISMALGYPVGLNNPVSPNFNTRDTVMADRFRGFYGYTRSDVFALQWLWD